MTTAEQNFQLLKEIEANRLFLLMAYEQNPKLLENAEPRIKQLFEFTESQVSSLPMSPLQGKQRGISLVELIIFIVIISVALVGILSVMNITTAHSADPLIHKQALVVAESLLEEIELQDFIDQNDGVTTVCPAASAVTAATRATVYHIVSCYNGFTMNAGIFDMTGLAVVGLGNYSANVTVVPTAAVWNGIPAGSAVLITVTVTDPQTNTISIDGYRTAY